MSEPLGGVTVEVKADLGSMTQGFAQAKQQATTFEKTASDSLAKVAKAADTLTTTQKALVTSLVSAKTTAAEASAVFGKTADSQKLLAAFTLQSAAANKTLEQQIGKTAAAQKTLASSAAQTGKTYENFFNGNFVDQWAKQSQAVGKNTAAYKLNQMQVQELVGAARHSLDALAAGASPARVLATHFATLAQSAGSGEGGVAGALGAIAKFFTPTVIGLGLITGATLLAVKATHDYNTELANFGKLTKGVGAGAGLTPLALQNASATGAGASGTTVKDARDLETQLLKTGQVSGQVFAGLLADQKKFAVGSGQSLKDAQADLTKMFVDPGKGADELEAKFGKLTASEIENIKTLQAQGDITGAQVALQKALDKSVSDLDGHLGGMKGAWDSFRSGASQAASEMAKLLAYANALALVGPSGIDKVNQALAKQAADAKTAAAAVANSKASAAGLTVAQSLDPDFAAKEALKNQAGQLERGVMGAGSQGDTAAFDAQTKALANVNRARETYINDSEKDHQMAALDAQANTVRAQKETAATRAQLGTIAAQKTRLELSGKVMSAAEVEQRAQDASDVASAKASKGANSHAEALAREAAAMVANAKGAIALGAAYLVSDTAAIKAEADRKAATDGTKKGIDLAAQARRQLNLDIAEGVASTDKEVAGLRVQAAAQAFANMAVANGTKTTEQAAKGMADALALRDATARAEAAHEVVLRQGNKATADEISADKAATEALIDKKAALDAIDAGQNEGAARAPIQASKDQAAVTKLETQLLYASNQERARRLAMLQKEQELSNKPGGAKLVASPAGQAAIKAAGDTAALAADQSPQFIKSASDAVIALQQAYALNAKTIGMSTEAAAAYSFEQGHLNDAAARGITLNDDQRAALHKLAGQYGETTKAALELERQQRAAAEAADFLSDEFSNTITDVLDGTAKASDAIKSLAKDLERELLKSALTGKGAFAGLLGTDKTDGPGQANQGLLSQVFGKLLGVGKGATPTGTQADPVWVQMAGGSGGDSSSQSGGLPGLGGFNFDFSGGDAAQGIPDLQNATPGEGFNFGGDAGANFIDNFKDVFKDNSTGGFVGALKNIFKSGGGGVGDLLKNAGSGIGDWIAKNQGAIGSGLGAWLATEAHDGMPAGAQGTGRTRAVDPRIFLSAPRLHDGLKPGEFPAILEHGEGVTSKRAAANQNHPRGDVHIHVYGVKDSAGFERNDRQIARGYKQRFGFK